MDYKSLEKIGIFYDENGKIEAFNESLFADHLCKKFNVSIDNSGKLYFYTNDIWTKTEESEAHRTFFNYFNSLTDNEWSSTTEKRYMEALKRICPVSDSLISGVDYVDLRNGLFHISSARWKFLKHTSAVFITTQLPVVFNKDSECPQFMQFLLDIFNTDQNMISLVQEIMGYCLCSNKFAQKFFIFYGTGGNGKSVLCEIIQALVGSDNTSHIPLEKFHKYFEATVLRRGCTNHP